MFKKLKNYKLILISKSDTSVQELNPKKIFFIAIAVSFLIFLSFITMLASDNLNKLISLKSIRIHKNNNSKLQTVIEQQKNQIDHLMIEIDKLSIRDDNMRNLLKLPIIDSDIRKLGVGGSKDSNNLNDLEYLLPKNIDLEQLDNDINFLLRTVNLGKLSYGEIENKAKQDKEKIFHYPAIHPVSRDDSKFSSGFGYRYDPFTKRKKIHEGHDFSAKIGTEVVATADGVVKSSRYFGSFGNFIEVDHGNGFITCYGHLSKRLVKRGETIERGQLIGKVGNTGRSTAAHLHYEIRYNNKNLDPSKFYFDLSL